MNTDVEEFVRQVFADSEVPALAVDPGEVVAIGRRVRRLRRRRAALAGVAAACLIAFGVAQLVVPAAGTPLTPLVWAAGEGQPGSEAGAWITGNGHRFVISIRDAYLGDRNAYVLSRLNTDGSEQVMMAASPLLPEDLPTGTFGVSTEPEVSFMIFPAGAHDIRATDKQTSGALSISTMTISSPHGGPDYVAVAMDAGHASSNGDELHITWVDAQAQTHSFVSAPVTFDGPH